MSYALITGASSGIGRCYVNEMAARGYNIIAISNQAEALIQTQAEVERDYNVTVRCICIDLTERNAAHDIFARCEAEAWEVEVLICNAGMLLFSTLMRTEPARLVKIIELHCITVTLLCRLFGQRMKERRKGGILLMSSSTAWLPYPTISHYSATKSYIKNFAFALWYELHRYGVNVTAVFPGAVDTPLYNLEESMRRRFVRLGIMMRPEVIARRGVKALLRGRRRVTPGLFTKIVVAICSLLPARALNIALRLPIISRLLDRV